MQGEVRLATGKASGLPKKVVVLTFIKGIAEPAAAITVDAGIGAACADEMPVVTPCAAMLRGGIRRLWMRVVMVAPYADCEGLGVSRRMTYSPPFVGASLNLNLTLKPLPSLCGQQAATSVQTVLSSFVRPLMTR